MRVQTLIEDYNIICPYCNCVESVVKEMVVDSNKIVFGECKNCKKMTFQQRNGEEMQISQDRTVTCPFCHSTNCKKISTASKVGKTLMWGVLAAGAVSKTWHCNNCGSNFG